MLQLKYKTAEEIPQGMEGLYTERDGEWHFTGVTGIKTQTDIDKIMTGLTKEREDHKGTKTKLAAWEGMDRADVDAKLAKLAELELAVQGSVPKDQMEKRLEELAEVRVKNRLMPVERERDALKKKLEEAEKVVAGLAAEKTQRTIHDKVREAAITAKVSPEVMADVLLLSDNVFTLGENSELLTRENVYGVDAGLTPETFFATQQERRPYWWPASTGGGSKGTGGKGGAGGSPNPWASESWNLTEQGKVVREQGLEKAQQLAKLAGTTIGAARPVAKK